MAKAKGDLKKINKFLESLKSEKFINLPQEEKAANLKVGVWKIYNFTDKLKMVNRIEKVQGSNGYKVLDPTPLTEADYELALKGIREATKLLKNDPARKVHNRKPPGVDIEKHNGTGPVAELEGPLHLGGNGTDVSPLVDRTVKVTLEGDAEAIKFMLNGNGGR